MGLLSRIEDIGGGLLGLNNGQSSAPTPDASAAPQGPQPYKPGFLDTLGEVLFNGMAPADAGAHLRQLHYQTQMMQAMPGLINSLINPDATPSVQPGAVQPAAAPQGGATMQPASAPMGSTAQTSAPVGPGGLSLSNPRVARTLVAGALTGVLPNVDKVVQVLQATRPSVKIGPDGRAYNEYDPSVINQRFANPANVNGTVVDLNDPNNVNRAVPEAPVKGAMPVYNNRGEVVDWTLPKGVQGAIQLQQAPQMLRAQAAAMDAQTGRGNLQLHQTDSANFAPPPGFIIGHPGARRARKGR